MPTPPALHRYIDDELGRSADLAGRVLTATLAALREYRDSVQAGERGDALALLSLLQRQGDPFQRRFVESLRARVAEEVANGPADLHGPGRAAAAGLSLMDDSRVDVDIAISNAAQSIDEVAEWELRELQMFTSALLGQDHVTAASNPFRPLLHASALWDAACVATPEPAQRVLLLRQSCAAAAPLLKNAWAAACSRLEEQGVQPCTYRTVVLPGAGSARSGPAPVVPTEGLGALWAKANAPGLSTMGAASSSDPAASVPHAAHGASVGGGIGGGESGGVVRAVSGGAGNIACDVPSGNAGRFDELLSRLDACLVAPGKGATGAPDIAAAARLESHRSALVESAATPQDGRVIELLAQLFETIFSDPALAPPFRDVIARLQVAALRVALQSPSMMESSKHPVWLLIDRIGELSTAFRSTEDPGLLATKAFCARLADEIARAQGPDAELFRRALARLEAWLQEQTQAALDAARPAIDALTRAEQRTVLQAQWSEKFASILARTSITPGVRHFVTQVWSRVVSQAVLKSGTSSDALNGHLKTLEDLLWSVQLPDHPQSRQRLLGLLPSLLKRLQDGMDTIDMPATEKQAVLDELMRIHAEALRPGAKANAASTSRGHAPHRPADAAASATDRRAAPSDSVIDSGVMDTVPASMLPTPEEAARTPAPALDALKPFERRRLFIQGRWNQCQLLWRSEHAQYFVFAGDTAGRTHSLTRGALSRMNEAGLLLPVQTKPLLQRAIDHLSRQPAVH